MDTIDRFSIIRSLERDHIKLIENGNKIKVLKIVYNDDNFNRERIFVQTIPRHPNILRPYQF